MTLEITWLVAAMLPCWLIGMLTLFYWFKAPRKPSDTSNRINNITSWWIGLTRPEVLGNAWEFFRNDVMDNVEAVERSKEDRR